MATRRKSREALHALCDIADGAGDDAEAPRKVSVSLATSVCRADLGTFGFGEVPTR